MEHLPCYPNVLTVKEISRILRISLSKTYQLVHSHVFPSIKIGRDYRIPEDSFWEWFRKAEFRPSGPLHASAHPASIDSSSILGKLLNGGLNDGRKQ